MLTSSIVCAVPVREPACARPKGGRGRAPRCQAGVPVAQCNRRAALGAAAAAVLTLAVPSRACAAPAFGAPRETGVGTCAASVWLTLLVCRGWRRRGCNRLHAGRCGGWLCCFPACSDQNACATGWHY